jgi:hypothetical protein
VYQLERSLIVFVLVNRRDVGTPMAVDAVLAPQVADMAVRRWQTYTSRDAILATTKQTFNDVALARRDEEGAP